MKKRIIILLFALSCVYTTQAQMAHYYIGTNQHNEVARVVKSLSDGSSIIAGYIYDFDATHAMTNIDNLLLRVDPNGTIVWQQQWGTTANDLLYDMILTQNGDIVCVGTTGRTNILADPEQEDAKAPSANNTAAIYRFDINGNFLFDNYVRDNASTHLSGEVFNSVCELSNGDLVAVGAHSAEPGAVDGLVSVFDPNLNWRYNEVIPVSASQTDGFNSVVADNNDIYVTGLAYTPSTTYYDMSIMNYTPGTSSGTVNWVKLYDMSYTDDAGNVLDSDWPHKIFLSTNNDILVTGLIIYHWGTGLGDRHYIFRCNSSGNASSAWLVNNGTTPAAYSNTSMIYPLNNDELFISNVPAASGYDYNQTGVVSTFVNVWASHISSLTGNNVSVSTEFRLWDNESVQSLDVKSGGGNLDGYLYMAGNAAPEVHSSDNDIYYAIVNPTLQDASYNCPNDVTTTLTSITVGVNNPTIPNNNFWDTSIIRISFTNPNLSSDLQCGATLANKPARPNNTMNTIAGQGIYPNPADDFLQLTGWNNASYTITDAIGKIMTQGNVSNDQKISITQLPAGMYIIQLAKEGSASQFKFVKQ